jgi:hypothetical protein
MLKYAIPLVFVSGIALAQTAPTHDMLGRAIQNPGATAQAQPAQPNPSQPQQAQPAPSPAQPNQPTSAVVQNPPTGAAPNAAHMNARNAAIQRIEQALQELKANNQ